MSESETEKKWYAVQVASGYENYVTKVLQTRVQEMGLEDSFARILVPTEKVVEMKQGKKCESEKKFFPGYVLVEMELNDDTWYLVRKTPKVLGFIGSKSGKDKSNKPTPVRASEIDAVLNRVEESADKPKPKVLFEPGEVVRVTEGPFADFSGVVEEVNYEKNRLRVAVLIFGRSTPVELEFSQVEKS